MAKPRIEGTKDRVARLKQRKSGSHIAMKILGDQTLRTIAKELVDTLCKNSSIDWTVKKVCAPNFTRCSNASCVNMDRPDKQEKATQTVLEQAELLCKD
jgi:type I restriction enzyme R subunit